MISQIGTVSSYKELGEQFLDFVQKSNDTTVPWEVIDDRLDEFYGATIRFPVNDYSKKFTTSIPNLDASDKDSIGFMVVPQIHSSFKTITYSNVASNPRVRYSSSFMPSIIKLLCGSYPSSSVSYYIEDEYYSTLDYRPRPSNLDYWDSRTASMDLDSFFNFFNNMDELSSNVIQYDVGTGEYIDYLVGKTYVYILCPTLTSYYYYGVEDIFLNKLSNYLVGAVNKLTSLMYSVNSDIDEYKPMVEVMFYTDFTASDYFYTEDSAELLRTSELAIFDFLSFMSTKLNSYHYLYLPDIYSESYIDTRINAYNGRDNTIYINFNDKGTLTYLESFPYTYNDGITIDKSNLCISSPYFYTDNPDDSYSTFMGSGYIMCAYVFGQAAIINSPNITFKTKEEVLSDNNLFCITDRLYYQSFAYISLQYNKIIPTTYNEWLTNTKDNYMSESFDSRRRIPAYYNNAETWRTVTISNQYQNDIPNIFKDTGEVLFISPHIKYDKNLWMCEQGGIACDQETRTQNIEDNVIRHRKLTSNFSGYPTQEFVKVPPFPSLGCPMFTINSSQLAQEKINYYFIRDNNSASIVVYVPVTDSMTYNYTVQHMSFGVLDCFSISEQFMYPLYVAGGNGGLCQEHWSYYNPWGGVPNHEVGNMYKLDMENITMSNTNLLLSSRFNGANVSNFRVLCPDGHWDNIFNVTQNVSLIVDPDYCHPDSWTPRYYVLQKPVVGGSELGDIRYGGTTTLNGANSIKRIDTGYIDPGYKDSIVVEYAKTFHANALVQPVMPVFSSHKELSGEGWPRHRYGVIGKIPRCYSTWSRHLKFGELEIGGKRFLSIPSAYDHRTWYPAYKTSVGLANLEAEAKAESKRGDIFYNDYIYDYLLLKLED